MIKDPKGKLETQALLCTDLTATPVQILQWFWQRWQVEVTFEEARAHLGVETSAPMVITGHRPYYPCATRPVLNRDRRCPSAALLSIRLSYQKPLGIKRRYRRLPMPRALVRQQLWQMQTFQMSSADVDTVKIPRALFNTWSDLLCYAA